MDIRIEEIFREAMRGDKSFQEPETMLSLLFGGTKYTKHDMRQTLERGIKHGIEIGLRKASLNGQKQELYNNSGEFNEKLDKMYKFMEENDIRIEYHFEHGMICTSLNR